MASNYTTENRIGLEYTAPYTPQKNDRREAANRAIMETDRSMF